MCKMLNDNETVRDYLNFRIVASPVARMILTSGDAPISIGVSGNWGAGKSSMVRMIGDEIRQSKEADKFILLEFNAWLYQGYEDARMALLQQVSDRLEEVAKEKKSCVEKVKDFMARVNWLRVMAAIAPVASRAVLGGAVAGPIGAVVASIEGIIANAKNAKAEDVQGLLDSCDKALPMLRGFIKEQEMRSVPKEIQALRRSFESVLQDLDMKLVVFVDDLDRCLPDTAISTLEAMRMLLFTPRTVFILAADEAMIRRAVKARYGDDGIDEDRVTSYFDKLIQVPVRVPRPASNEVKNYLVLMLAEMRVSDGTITKDEFESGYRELMKKIRRSWEGRLTKKAIIEAFGQTAQKIINDIEIADQISDVMTTAPSIAGNPRLIKRFLNNLIIRNAVAVSQEMTLSFDVMVKMHLLERCAPKTAFDEIADMVATSDDGKAEALLKWERQLAKGDELVDIPEKWEKEFFMRWISLDPKLGEIDLRPYIYLSQEEKRYLVPVNDLSPEGRKALEMLLSVSAVNQSVVEGLLRRVEKSEVAVIFDKTKNHARVQQYKLDSLRNLLCVVKASPELWPQFIGVLEGLPAGKRSPAIVPLIAKESVAKDLLSDWVSDSQTPGETHRAIIAMTKGAM